MPTVNNNIGHRPSMRIRVPLLIAALVLLLSAFAMPVANAYQILTPIVSPFPVTAGQPFKLSANISAPLVSGHVSVTVSYGNQTILNKSISFGHRGTLAVPFPITIPTSPRGQRLQIFMVALQGAEKYVGEPGGNAFFLEPHCAKPVAGKVLPCVYATPKYWIRTEAAAKKR